MERDGNHGTMGHCFRQNPGVLVNLGLNFMGWEGISVPVGKQAMDHGTYIEGACLFLWPGVGFRSLTKKTST